MINTDVLRDEAARLGPWLHDVDLPAGFSTGSITPTDQDYEKFVGTPYSPYQMIWRVAAYLYPDGLQGRSFLDCGCNAGGHSFAAAKLGAGRVLGFDPRQHWLDQAAFLARQLDAPDVSFAKATLSDLPALVNEPFDITLFSGLFYHLADPAHGLKIVADLTRELLIVNTSALPKRYKALVPKRESSTQALSGIDGLSWLPTGPAVMKDILDWCGFPHVRVDLYWDHPGTGGWRRLQLLAARNADTFRRYDELRPQANFFDKPPIVQRIKHRLGFDTVS